MKIAGKSIVSLLWVVFLTACSSFVNNIPTVQAEKLPTTINIAITTQTLPANNPTVTVSGTPTIVVLENGLTWRECVLPNQDYANSMPDVQLAKSCLNMEYPKWTDNDGKMAGERIEGIKGTDLQQIIGNDVYSVKHANTSYCCRYEFSKNREIILELDTPFTSFDPSRHLWKIGGKLVWELIADPPTIIVDGIDYNAAYQLDGIFMPYSIHDKLLYIAKSNGKFHLVYDGKNIGVEFDEIYIRYCCANTQVVYGNGIFWFWGKRDGDYYVVGIQ